MSEKKITTKEKVLKAAAKQFALKGFDGTTTRAITDEAGANLSAIPIYFKTKEKLYKEALEYTIAQFNIKSKSFEKELNNAEKLGLIIKESAWDYIVEYVGNLVEWIFDPDYYYERLLLNRELLDPSDAYISVATPIFMLYWRFEMLILVYTDNDDTKWAKHYSFMILQTLFAYGNFPELMKKVTERDMSNLEVVAELKMNVKRDVLTGIKAVLKSRRIG